MIEFFKSLPIIATILEKIEIIVEKVIAAFSAHQEGKWNCDLEQDVDKLDSSKTSKDKIDAGKDLVSDIRTLR